MSASHAPPPASGAAPAAGAVDPSMEDILASIRRILSEDEAETPAQPASPAQQVAAPPPPHAENVFALDASMIVEEPVKAAAPAAAIAPVPARLESDAGLTVPNPQPATIQPDDLGTLVAPETAAAAATSVSALLRTLVAEREQVAVYRGGPTIEDMVREEIRPLLKAWLDANLPPVVERLVRTEIERVVGRAVG
jgi:cell pole-organizing protein PopZ